MPNHSAVANKQQTWEDPSFISPHTNRKGDNDPIDVIEIGSSVGTVGQIKQVKILGIIGLLDQDETDWKVVVIDANDPLFEKMNGNPSSVVSSMNKD